ncbi:MAG TPA: AAA family ATPase [Nitrospira sp.]|nr:AAA family ATPase [Nitrospira sp.]
MHVDSKGGSAGAAEAGEPQVAGNPRNRSLPVAEDWPDLGLKQAFLEELALKILLLENEISSRELASRMKLSLSVSGQIIQWLRKDRFCEVKGLAGGIYRVAITEQGRDRALDALARNGYVGPAPVPLENYVERVAAQSIRGADVQPDDVSRIFNHLVLSEQALESIGTAIASGSTLFIYGPPGTGKTAIAEAIAGAFNDAVWIPYAVEIDAQIITLFDPAIHQGLPVSHNEEYDERWVLCRRPCVILGGELTIEMLDLQFNPTTGFYTAPPQMKANNGVLVVDDFGRQRVRPEELLNRWIVPLERRVDLLALAGGKKFDIPFDLMVVFATNLDLRSLGDDAFLRRMSNKIKMTHVSREQFHCIFRNIAADYGVQYDASLTDHLIDLLTQNYREPLRPCYPRDILRQINWMARYYGEPPRLDAANLEKACRNYFLPGEDH